MRRTLAAELAIVGISIGATALASDALDIGPLLTRAPLVCGSFSQSKTLKALTRPLVSNGRVIFAAGTGVLWKITSPFPSQVLVKADALIRWDNDNQPKRTGLGQTPQFRALSDVFLAVFAGDTSRLAASFDTRASIDSDRWSLDLTPRDKDFASRISKIYVAGGQFVEELRINEPQGDRTEIRFNQFTADSCVLSNSEKGSLAH
jgi:hypothetical protein